MEAERIASEKARQVYEEPVNDELGELFDETDEFWAPFETPVIETVASRTRPLFKKKAPRRTGRNDSPPTMIRGMR